MWVICSCFYDLHAALNIAPVRKKRDVIDLHLFLWFASCTEHWSCQVWKVLYLLSLSLSFVCSLWVPFLSLCPSSSPSWVSFPFLPFPFLFFRLVLSFLFFSFLFSPFPPSFPSLLPLLWFPLGLSLLLFLFSLLSLFLPFSSFSFFSVFPLPFLSFLFFSFSSFASFFLSFFSGPSLPFLLSFPPLWPSPFSLFCSCPLSTLLPSLGLRSFGSIKPAHPLSLCREAMDRSRSPHRTAAPVAGTRPLVNFPVWSGPNTSDNNPQAFHQVRLLHTSGIKALVNSNLPKDYLWLRILSRFLQDKLASPNIFWAYHNIVASLHKPRDGAQDMAPLLLLDLKYMVLDWVVWYQLFLPLHLRGPPLSFLDNSMDSFDLHILDQVLLLPRDLHRLPHRVDQTQELLILLANNHWEESQTYLWDNIGNLMKNTMIPRSWMDWHYLELSDLQAGPNWRTLKVVIRLQYPWVSYYTKAVKISGFVNLLQAEKSMLQQWEQLARLSLWVKYYLNFEAVELTLTNWHSTRLFKMAKHWRKEKLSKVWQNRLETNCNDGPLQFRLIPALSTR